MATNKYFQCPYCNKKFDRQALCAHLEKEHLDELPEEFTPLRMTFHIVNKKPITYRRPCRICKSGTDWDENKGRYNFLCNKKSCHDKWVEQMKQDMGDKMGSNRPTANPEGLQKMLANRKISGTYQFQDGGTKTYTGSYEKKALEFMDKIMNIKSEDLMCPGPVLQYSLLSPNAPKNIDANDTTDYSEYHTYIPDMYYIPYNLLIEVKDGGNKPNKNEKLSETRKRQMTKEKHIIENTDYNYLRLTDNDFSQLLSVFADLKLHLVENDTSRTIHVNEDATTIGAFPSQSVMQSGPVIVNYLQNNVFAKPEIGIADSPKLQRMIIKNKFDELEEVDSSFLFNAKYSLYKVNLSESTISLIKENLGKQVSEDFLYESVFGHKCYSNDQIIFEESAVPVKDFYETLQEDEDMINKIIKEGYIKDSEDIYYNKEKFDSGEINLCFITGLSGSGKSTLGSNLSKLNSKVEHYQLDDVIFNDKFSMENLKEYGDLIYSFFKTTGSKYYKTVFENYEKLVIKDFIKYTISYSQSHKDTKFVLDGIWIFMYINPAELSKFAVYIKGTSSLKSMIRAAKRDFNTDTGHKNKVLWLFKRIKADLKDMAYFESKLKEYQNYFGK